MIIVHTHTSRPRPAYLQRRNRHNPPPAWPGLAGRTCDSWRQCHQTYFLRR
jgi:hypothetical protein